MVPRKFAVWSSLGLLIGPPQFRKPTLVLALQVLFLYYDPDVYQKSVAFAVVLASYLEVHCPCLWHCRLCSVCATVFLIKNDGNMQILQWILCVLLPEFGLQGPGHPTNSSCPPDDDIIIIDTDKDLGLERYTGSVHESERFTGFVHELYTGSAHELLLVNLIVLPPVRLLDCTDACDPRCGSRF